MCERKWLEGVNRPLCSVSRTACRSLSCSSAPMKGFTSSGVNTWRANGGGVVFLVSRLRSEPNYDAMLAWDPDALPADWRAWFEEQRADWARPDFTLRCDPDKAMIGPGSSTSWYVHVNRANGFSGPVQVDVKGLPNGVVASPLTIPPTMAQGVVVLSAGADAAVDAANVEVIGTGSIKGENGKEETLTRLATANEEIYLPGGDRYMPIGTRVDARARPRKRDVSLTCQNFPTHRVAFAQIVESRNQTVQQGQVDVLTFTHTVAIMQG